MVSDDSLQQAFGVGAPDGATECVVEANRVLDVADRVVVAAEDRGEPAEMAVDRSVVGDGPAGGGWSTGVRREALVERGSRGLASPTSTAVSAHSAGRESQLVSNACGSVITASSSERALSMSPRPARIQAWPPR